MNAKRKDVISKLDSLYSINAELIEQSIYNFAVHISNVHDVTYLLEDIYSNKIENIISLLINNDYLIDGIKNKTIDPTQIGFMSYNELNPNKFKLLTHMEDVVKEGTNIFTCPKCKGRNCSVTQRQTRSADESATTIIQCNICYKITKLDG